MQLLKRSVHSVLRRFGYRLEKIKTVPQKWVDVNDAIYHNSKDNLEKFYSDEQLLTDYVNEDRHAFYKAVTDFFKEKNIDLRGKNVIDVGCGTGHLLHYMNEYQKFGHGTGLEYSEEAVKLAKGLFPQFEFHQYDISESWPKQYDVVVCTEVLEHLLHPDVALRNLMGMCANNGYILITVPNGRIDTFGGHINFWSPESWKIFIASQSNGFANETGTIREKGINFALISKS